MRLRSYIQMASLTFVSALVLASSAGAALRHRTIGSIGPVALPSNVAMDSSTETLFVAAAGESAIDKFLRKGPGEYESIGQLTAGLASQPFAFSSIEPAPVTIDSATGDVYVFAPDPASFGHDFVDKFDAEGKYLCQLSGVGRGCHVNADSELGSPPTFGEITGLAFDSHGNIYVADYEAEAVDEFTAEGVDVGQIRGGGITNPSGVAIDSNGVVYVQNYFGSGGQVVKLIVGVSDEIISHTVLDAGQSFDVAVNTATNAVYVDHGSSIAVYDAEANRLDEFGLDNASSEGVAVYTATGEVYVSDKINGRVDVFEAVVVPDVTKCEVMAVTPTSATFVGTVNPDKTKAEYFFQYGTSTSYGQETEHVLVGLGNEGESYVPAETTVTGLSSGTTYHCRVDATNGTGVVNEGGEDGTFTTPPAVVLSTGIPKDLQGVSATLVGHVTPEGNEAKCYFQYGSTNEYGSKTGELTVSAGVQEEEVAMPVSGLEPVVGYHYRLVCENSLGTSFGVDQAFITPPSLTTVNGEEPFVTGIAAHEATLHGTIGPGRGITTYRFVYGISETYEAGTAEAYTQLNEGESPTEQYAIEQLITGLNPETIYHYALIATNPSGTTTGPDHIFTTLPAPASVINEEGGSEPAPPVATIAQPGTLQLLPIPVFPKERPIVIPRARCKKGFVKKSGKCVRKPHRKIKRRKK